jgi:hypothetical protein
VVAGDTGAASPAGQRPEKWASESSPLTVFGAPPPPLRDVTSEHDPGQGDPGLLPGVFKIRLARSRSSTQDAGVLVQRRYAWRGYQIPGPTLDPDLRTFAAYRDNVLVGTLSLRVDSDKGLSADDLYRDEIARLRRDGASLCEFTRLAVGEESVSSSVLGGLFHTAYLYAHRVRGCEFGVIEVNPRHAVFYRRGLYFQSIGPERINRRVNAPAVLLCVSFERIDVELEKYFADPDRSVRSRSPFAHWFPPDEAAGVLNRLRNLES